jgi:hypothetical protein
VISTTSTDLSMGRLTALVEELADLSSHVLDSQECVLIHFVYIFELTHETTRRHEI